MYYVTESLPFHLLTDELVIENAAPVVNGDPDGLTQTTPLPLYVMMEESIFDVTGPLHFKVGAFYLNVTTVGSI